MKEKFDLKSWLHKEEPKMKVVKSNSQKGKVTSNLRTSEAVVEQLILYLEEENIDITDGYQNWRNIGFAFADEYGELGRGLFHRVSRMNSIYDAKECDVQFDKCLKAKGHGITLGTFIHLVKQVQIPSKSNDTVASHQSHRLGQMEEWLNLHYDLRFNLLRSTLEIKEKSAEMFRVISDRDFNSILMSLKRDGIKCSTDLLSNLINSDFVEVFNPVQAYIKSLPEWDGKDHIHELSKSIEVSNREFWEVSLKKWFVAFVASLLEDKIVNHQVMVLCGGQGIGKTTWILKLVPEELKEYVFSGTINPGNKDSLAMLSEMILINLDEMDNMNRSDSGTLKSLITIPQITVRKPYARFSETKSRVASFIGSVNDKQFLNDSTGSRRFLVIDAQVIDFKSQIDIGQIYRQSLALFKDGFKFYFDTDEVSIIESNNASFQRVSPEEELLMKHFEIAEWAGAEKMTATEIQIYLNSVSNLKTSPVQVGRVLSKKGYVKRKEHGVQKWAVFRRV